MKILIADNHAIVREGLARILGRELEQARVDVDGAGTGGEAIELFRAGLGSQEPCQLVIVGTGLPDASGLEVLKQLRILSDSVPVLVLSEHEDESLALRALRSGADGYLTTGIEPGELVRAVKKVLGGGKYLRQELAERMVVNVTDPSAVAPHHKLSDKELEVLRRLAVGKRVIDVAAEMSLSAKTVSTHRTRLLRKLNLSSNADLIKYARDNRLVN